MPVRSPLFRGVLVMGVVAGLVVGCSGDGGGSSNTAATDGLGVDPSNELRITLEGGVLEGDDVDGARQFLQVPYAAPPVGDLRWRAPEPAEPWDGVRHETEFAEACPQNESVQGPASMNEDCLYANVWSPSPAPEDAPVMVWIHGGGNFAGGAGDLVPGSDELWYDGQFFARDQGVVLVTFNYRLGPMGFFPHPDLAEEGSPFGNQGLFDQRQMLEWVQENIEHFGGNPDNVTIFGESAGSADVCYHVASPGSRGLFHRAISQSGGCTFADMNDVTEASGEDKVASMEAFAEAVGCPADSDDMLGCLRDLPTEEVMAQANQPEPSQGDMLGDGAWSFGPVIDGEDGVIPVHPREAFDEGDIADVPYLLGSNDEEGTVFVFQIEGLTTQPAYEAEVRARFPEAADAVLAQYPASDFGGDFTAALAAAVGDSMLICGTEDTASRADAAGRPVYLYNFAVPWAISPDVLGATHAAEMSHVFGNPLQVDPENPDEGSVAVGEAMNAYWAAFAAEGDPNYEGAPTEWPRFDADAEGGTQRLQLDPDFEVVQDFRQEQCAFWQEQSG